MERTERNETAFKTVSGESNSVSPEMVNSRNETSLSTILSNCDLRDIYNVDEFGLSYLFLPDKIYHLKKDKFSVGKQSKFRITEIAAANALDEKLLVFAIAVSQM